MVVGSHKSMTRKDKPNISEKDREEMKAIIRPRLKFRETNKELLEHLEDKGFEIGETTLKELKKDIRDSQRERFLEIGEYELAQEHDFALDMMKYLMVEMKKLFNDPEVDKTRVSAEMRNIQRDLIDYYGSTELVENVFKYFNEEKEENKEKAVEEIREQVKKKKPTKKKKPILKTFA